MNPNSDSSNHLIDNALHVEGHGRAAPVQHFGFISGHFQSSKGTDGIDLPSSVLNIAAVWPQLPPHIRDAILTLADVKDFEKQHAELKRCERDFGDIARRLAQECRTIIERCQREEEWEDAELEFFEVILKGLLARL